MRSSKLADMFECLGYGGEANGMRRRRGLPVLTAQAEDPRRAPLFPADARSKRNIFEGPRLTKMHEKEQGVPGQFQNWTEVQQKKGPVQQLSPLRAPAYGVDPEFGGEPGYPLPSGGRVIGLDLPKTEDGAYDDPSVGTPEIMQGGGEVSGDWASPEDAQSFIGQYLEKLEDFESRTTIASKKFNDVNRDWLEDSADRPSVGRLLSQNFWSTFDRAIYGGTGGIQPIDTGEGRNMMAAIDHRQIGSVV